MDSIINSLGTLIYATLIYTPPLVFAAMGSCFSESSGVVNIGIEGTMTIGAFTGATVAYFTGNAWVGFLCAGLAGAVFGVLHAVATVSLNADQTITGTAINFLAPGVALLISKALFNSSDTPALLDAKLPMLFNNVFDGNTVWSRFLRNVFNNYATSFLMFGLVFLVWFIFYKTRFGLRLRAVGEHPRACDTLGINVQRTRYIAVIISDFFGGAGRCLRDDGDHEPVPSDFHRWTGLYRNGGRDLW